MSMLIPIVLVLLLVAVAVTFVVLRATRQSKPSEAEDDADGDPSTLAAADSSPAGDTTEHAGEQSDQGETVDVPEGEGRRGGGHGGDVRRGRARAPNRAKRPPTRPNRRPSGSPTARRFEAHAARADTSRRVESTEFGSPPPVRKTRQRTLLLMIEAPAGASIALTGAARG
jgi:hypothetical protein